MKFIKKKSSYVILAISILAFIALIPALFPKVQSMAISIVESYKNDDINDSFWARQMFAFASLGLLFFAVLDFFLLTQTGKDTIESFLEEAKKIFNNISKNKKYLFILMGLYFFGYYTIFRANFWNYAIDDLSRQMEGSREWVNFYRYFAEIGSIFIHTSTNIPDIAPLTQFIALFFISLASFFIIGIFSNNNYSIKLCFASLPCGLFPFFLSNYSYRYDSPYMALSLLISVIPFLFIDNFRNYTLSSILCLFIMCTSYQASNGIYIFMSILVFVSVFIKRNRPKFFLAKFTIASILCYALTLLLFSFLFIEQAPGGSYVDESVHLSMIIPNSVKYLKSILNGLNKSPVLFFSVVVVILFALACIAKTQAPKIATTAVVILAICSCIPLTFGSYLALGKAEFTPRAFIGIGVFIACLATFLLSIFQGERTVFSRTASFFAICLSYCCIAFSFAYGNAQCSQKEYINFRTQILAKDLSECITNSDETLEILFANGIGHAPSVEVLKRNYPFINDAIDQGLKDDRPSQFILESVKLVDLVEKANHDFRSADYPVLIDNAYQKIQGKDNRYIVTFKTPKFRTIKTRRFLEQ